MNKYHKLNLNLIKSLCVNSDLHEDQKNDMIEAIDRIIYLDKAIFSSSNKTEQYSVYMTRMYKKVLKQQRAVLIKALQELNII